MSCQESDMREKRKVGEANSRFSSSSDQSPESIDSSDQPPETKTDETLPSLDTTLPAPDPSTTPGQADSNDKVEDPKKRLSHVTDV